VTRALAVTDYPLFALDTRVGYIEQPNQAGALGRANAWAYNDKSMGVAAPFRPGNVSTDTLLIGDSIVNGGNPYTQSEKLGPLLGRRIGAVWPVAAGNWSLGNEAAYLDAHPEVLAGIDRMVLILNSGDFAPLQPWWSDRVHPLAHDRLRLTELVSHFVLSRPTSHATDGEVDYRPWWRRFRSAWRRPVLIVAYPMKDELERHDLRILERKVAALAGPGTRILSLGRAPAWHPSLYRDDRHPTAAGNAVLARLIAKALEARQSKS
jgi:hypothetical protein